MEITITHARYAPRWTMLQDMIRTVTANPSARLIGILRDDGGCDYRAPGGYTVRVDQDNGTILTVKLNIVPVGA